MDLARKLVITIIENENSLGYFGYNDAGVIL